MPKPKVSAPSRGRVRPCVGVVIEAKLFLRLPPTPTPPHGGEGGDRIAGCGVGGEHRGQHSSPLCGAGFEGGFGEKL